MTDCSEGKVETDWDDSPWKGSKPDKDVIALYGKSSTPRAIYEPLHGHLSTCLVVLHAVATLLKEVYGSRAGVENEGKVLSKGKTMPFGLELVKWSDTPAWTKPPAFKLTSACPFLSSNIG